ncbi:MAG: hypothetical protein QF522_08405 [Acidimicrobiales bacterium]|nr:hypothetical protein [Acidimicrobiales bacterium]
MPDGLYFETTDEFALDADTDKSFVTAGFGSTSPVPRNQPHA